MKNAFKLGFLALALSLTVVACGESGKKAEGTTDTTLTDSSAIVTDTTAKDTTVKDSTVKDTTVKTTTTKTEVKH